MFQYLRINFVFLAKEFLSKMKRIPEFCFCDSRSSFANDLDRYTRICAKICYLQISDFAWRCRNKSPLITIISFTADMSHFDAIGLVSEQTLTSITCWPLSDCCLEGGVTWTDIIFATLLHRCYLSLGCPPNDRHRILYLVVMATTCRWMSVIFYY